jgi:Ca2+-binding EF-hand superfamily protein
MTFYDYMKLPIFIAEKLFQSFTKSSTEGLNETEFVEGFFKLYMGNFEETINVIFNLIDFNKDGIIKKDDAKIILSYLPLNELNEEKQDKKDLVSKIFGAQIKSLEEIDSILSDTFDKYDGQMNLSQFTEIVKEKNSEIFLQILCFLYEQMPFSSKNIQALKKKI